MLARAGVKPLRDGADPLFSWAAVDGALSPKDVATLRANARARGFQIQTSTWTLAGYPALVAQWHPTKNGELTPWDIAFSSHKKLWWKWHPTKNARTPTEVVAGSVKKYWWRCAIVSSHVWETSPARRTRDGSGCPYCAIRVRPHAESLVFLRTTSRGALLTRPVGHRETPW